MLLSCAIWIMLTRSQTAWGNRPDGDVDNTDRMVAVARPAEVMTTPARDSKALIRFTDEICEKKSTRIIDLPGTTRAYTCPEKMLLPDMESMAAIATVCVH